MPFKFLTGLETADFWLYDNYLMPFIDSWLLKFEAFFGSSSSTLVCIGETGADITVYRNSLESTFPFADFLLKI